MPANVLSDGITYFDVFKIRRVLTLPLVWQISNSHVRHLPHLDRSIKNNLICVKAVAGIVKLFTRNIVTEESLSIFLTMPIPDWYLRSL